MPTKEADAELFRLAESEAFRVPKQRTPVDVLLADGTWRKCSVFLAARSPHHDGAERVSDLLELGKEFVPAQDEGTDRITLFSRAAIAAVRVEPWAEAAPETTGLPIEHAVGITLSNGASLEGLLTFAAPPDKARVIDHLNGAPLFFMLQEKSAVALVNKRHVVRVELR